MKYVIDSNVALKWVIDEPNSDKARRLRDDYRNGLCEILAPDFFIGECGYALFKLEHQGKVVQADQLLATILLDCPLLEESISIVATAAAVIRHIQANLLRRHVRGVSGQRRMQFRDSRRGHRERM